MEGDKILRVDMTTLTTRYDDFPADWELLGGRGRPFSVYANLGAPDAEGRFVVRSETTPEGFAAHARRWLEAGARIVGGCCGTTAEHIECVVSRRLGLA